jgi:hypothetical protein
MKKILISTLIFWQCMATVCFDAGHVTYPDPELIPDLTKSRHFYNPIPIKRSKKYATLKIRLERK